MRNLVVYYFSIMTPPGVLAYLAKNNLIDSLWFTVLLFTYAFVYRSITDYLRLRSKDVIDRKQFWKILIPGARAKYFKELYLR